jgi:RNA polymerase sigma-70 factor, ECF subfamily
MRSNLGGAVIANEGLSSHGSDEAVLNRLAQRDESALAELYDRHGRTAFALAHRMVGDAETAEEVVQEAFLAIWRRAETYRQERGAVRSWLLAVVRNRAIDVIRARESRPRTTTIDDLPIAASDNPEQQALTLAAGSVVRAAVAALPAEQRTAVELAYFAGLSYPEIAARIGVPLGTVKSRLRLALDRLRVRLTGEFTLAEA